MLSKIFLSLIALSPVQIPAGDSISLSCPAAIVCPAPVVCPPPVICPAPEPVPVEIKGFNVLPIDDQTIKVSIASIPVGAAKIKITSISTVGREVGVKVGPNPEFPAATVWPQSVQGFHPGWQIDVQALALDSTGKEMVKSQSVTVKMPGDPTVVWPPIQTPNPTPVPPVGTQGTVYDALKLGLQNALSSSKVGDTILFSAGTYQISSTIIIPQGRMLYSNAGAVIKGPASGFAFLIQQPDVKLVGLTLDNAQIKMDTNPKNILVDNCIIQNYTANAFSIRSQVSGKFTNNLWKDGKSGFTIYDDGGYAGLTIANNEIVNVAAGFHIDHGASNLLFEQNYTTGVGTAPWTEFQAGPDGVIFQDNWFEKPNLSSNKGCSVSPNNCYALGNSIPLNTAHNVIARRNVTIAPERPDGTGVRYAYELGGYNTLIEDNWIEGTNVAFADTDGTASGGVVTVRNNYVINPLRLSEFSFPSGGRQLILQNNGTMNEARLKYLITRGRPARNKRF